MNRLHSTVALLSLLLAAATGRAQTTDPTAITKRLDQVAAFYAVDHRFMGTVLVATGDTILLSKGYGSANLEWNIPSTPEVKYRLGSLTKQFTAALVLMLEQDGNLHIEDPVSSYLPEAPAAWEKVTLADLMAHSSGIADLTHDPTFRAWQMAPHTRAEVLSFITNKPLEFLTGSKAEYSNSNFIVLGMVLENISHKSYADLLRERILIPLRMTSTGLDTDDTIVPQHAQGYKLIDGKLLLARAGSMTIPWSAGSMYSTAGDLLRWEQGLFTGHLLSDTSLKKMTTARAGDFGFGVEVHTGDSLQEIDHSGSIEGFNTHLLYIPEKHLTVAVLGNVNGRTPDILTDQLRDVVLSKEVILPSERKTLPIARKDLGKFEGTFDVHPSPTRTFSLVIAIDADGLTAAGGGEAALPLLYQGLRKAHPRFYQPKLDAEIEFVSDADGSFTNIVVHQNSNHSPGKRR